MTAREARTITDKALSIDNDAFKAIYDTITAQAGKCSIETTFGSSPAHMVDALKRQLATDGYKIDYWTGDQRDPREHAYWTVSW